MSASIQQDMHPLLRWAWYQDFPRPSGEPMPHRSSLRSVLLELSKQALASGNLLTALDVNSIARNCGMDRKTVFPALRYLKKHGYIQRTEKRTGRTLSVIIYVLLTANHPINADEMREAMQTGASESAAPKIKRIQRDEYDRAFRSHARQFFDNDKQRDDSYKLGWGAWQQLNPDEFLSKAIFEGLAIYKAKCADRKVPREKIKWIHKFLESRYWEVLLKQAHDRKSEQPDPRHVPLHPSHTREFI